MAGRVNRRRTKREQPIVGIVTFAAGIAIMFVLVVVVVAAIRNAMSP